MSRDRRPLRERLSEFLIRRVVNTKARLARFLRPGSVIVLLVVSVAGAGAALAEFEVPSSGFWERRPVEVIFALLAAAAYLGYCAVVIGFRRVLAHSDENARLYKTCRDLAALVERETDLHRESIGVHVWTARGAKGMKRLERRATFVPVDRPPTAITWSRGKGVLGQCWLRDEWVLANLEELANVATEEEFDSMSHEARFGFTWHDVRATEHYKAVLAWPLHGGPENAKRVIGVLSIDVQASGGYDELDQLREAHRQDLMAHVAVCEAILEKR